MLWKVYKNESAVCHYLFGTMHAASQQAYTFASLAEKYILLSDAYVGEMDLNQAYSSDIMSYMVLENGSFPDFFRPKKYTKIKKIIAKAFDIDLDQYAHFSPFFIHNMVAEKVIKPSHSRALDHHLWEFASRHNKEMSGLESFDDQVAILRQIPQEFSLKAFKDSVKNISLFTKSIQALHDCYEKNDVLQLYRKSKKSMGKIRNLMIYERNQVMTKRIKEKMDDTSSFFAIGAAHYPGEKGILALLKKEGYKIKLLV